MIKKAFAFDLGTAYGVKFSNLGHLVSTLLNNVYAITALIFLFLIIIAGWGMIVGAGKGKSGEVEKGGKALSATIIGFAVVFLSYLLVRLIETITGGKGIILD